MDDYELFGIHESMRGTNLQCTECKLWNACGNHEWSDGSGFICQGCIDLDEEGE